MSPDVIITILTGAAGVAGGFFGGKRIGNNDVHTTAVSTVELLQVAVGELERQNTGKDRELGDLRGRVEVLEGLVTQRAAVEEVHQEVISVKLTVDKIAEKVGINV